MNKMIATKVFIKFALSPIKKEINIKNIAKDKFMKIFWDLLYIKDKKMRQNPKKKCPIILSSPVKLANLPGMIELKPNILWPKKNSKIKSAITIKKIKTQNLKTFSNFSTFWFAKSMNAKIKKMTKKIFNTLW